MPRVERPKAAAKIVDEAASSLTSSCHPERSSSLCGSPESGQDGWRNLATFRFEQGCPMGERLDDGTVTPILVAVVSQHIFGERLGEFLDEPQPPGTPLFPPP
jgi:hypothetical protein